MLRARKHGAFVCAVAGLGAFTAAALEIDGRSGVWVQPRFFPDSPAISHARDNDRASQPPCRKPRKPQVGKGRGRGVSRRCARVSEVSTTLASLYCDLDHDCGMKPEGGTQGRTRDLDPLYEIRRLPDGEHP